MKDRVFQVDQRWIADHSEHKGDGFGSHHVRGGSGRDLFEIERVLFDAGIADPGGHVVGQDQFALQQWQGKDGAVLKCFRCGVRRAARRGGKRREDESKGERVSGYGLRHRTRKLRPPLPAAQFFAAPSGYSCRKASIGSRSAAFDAW